MAKPRSLLIGPPHAYFVHGRCLRGQPWLAPAADRELFLDTLEAARQAFALRVLAYAIGPSGYVLVLRHQAEIVAPESQVRAGWQTFGGRALIPWPALCARCTSLSGIMQSLLARFSRQRNRRHSERGSLWDSRFHACLLTDDLAQLVATACVEVLGGPQTLRSGRPETGPVRLAPLPLTMLGGEPMPADQSGLPVSPLPPDEEAQLFAAFRARLRREDLCSYDHHFRHSWAMGGPGSLVEAGTRLGRERGRGRNRRERDFDDDVLGLRAIWG